MGVRLRGSVAITLAVWMGVVMSGLEERGPTGGELTRFHAVGRVA
jgi:hypothetical protein